MNKILKILGFGLIVWLIPSIVTFLASYLSGPYFFDVIAAVAIAVTVVVFTYLYFKDVSTHLVREGVIIGVAGVVVTVILDIVLIFLGINAIGFTEYAVYILPLYVIIPVITIGFGLYKNQMAENLQKPNV